jgi:hypothetical protein
MICPACHLRIVGLRESGGYELDEERAFNCRVTPQLHVELVIGQILRLGSAASDLYNSSNPNFGRPVELEQRVRSPLRDEEPKIPLVRVAPAHVGQPGLDALSQPAWPAAPRSLVCAPTGAHAGLRCSTETERREKQKDGILEERRMRTPRLRSHPPKTARHAATAAAADRGRPNQAAF